MPFILFVVYLVCQSASLRLLIPSLLCPLVRCFCFYVCLSLYLLIPFTCFCLLASIWLPVFLTLITGLRCTFCIYLLHARTFIIILFLLFVSSLMHYCVFLSVSSYSFHDLRVCFHLQCYLACPQCFPNTVSTIFPPSLSACFPVLACLSEPACFPAYLPTYHQYISLVLPPSYLLSTTC